MLLELVLLPIISLYYIFQTTLKQYVIGMMVLKECLVFQAM